MAMTRWLAPAALAAALGAGALMPAPARAQSDDLVRLIVDVADVAMRGGQPYYRYGNYGHADRLVVGRDRYGRKVYYRVVDRPGRYRHPAPRYGRDHRRGYGYSYRAPSRTKCNKHGKCKVEYYDPRYDRGRGWDD